MIYFISLYNNPNFPFDFAFFDNSLTILDKNGNIYTNVFNANHDILVWALHKHGFGNMSIVVGEISWPTDGDENANLQNAQGFMSRYSAGTRTPLRPGQMDAYLFSLIDEDAKSIQPGNFERHWGLFYYDGQPKYNHNLGTTNSTNNLLVAAKGIQYMAQQWCMMSPSASLIDPQVAPSVSYACANADCTSLGYMTSCGNITDRQNISYAFNHYYQQDNQLDSACKFPDNLSIITTQNHPLAVVISRS